MAATFASTTELRAVEEFYENHVNYLVFEVHDRLVKLIDKGQSRHVSSVMSEITEHLHFAKIQYALIRVFAPEEYGRHSRFALLTWVGPSTSQYAPSVVEEGKQGILSLLPDICVEVDAWSEDDIDPEAVSRQVAAALATTSPPKSRPPFENVVSAVAAGGSAGATRRTLVKRTPSESPRRGSGSASSSNSTSPRQVAESPVNSAPAPLPPLTTAPPVPKNEQKKAAPGRSVHYDDVERIIADDLEQLRQKVQQSLSDLSTLRLGAIRDRQQKMWAMVDARCTQISRRTDERLKQLLQKTGVDPARHGLSPTRTPTNSPPPSRNSSQRVGSAGRSSSRPSDMKAEYGALPSVPAGSGVSSTSPSPRKDIGRSRSPLPLPPVPEAPLPVPTADDPSPRLLALQALHQQRSGSNLPSLATPDRPRSTSRSQDSDSDWDMDDLDDHD